MSMNTLKINGNVVPDLYIDTSEAFNRPKKNIETINVPGRNGDLVIDYGTFQNVMITYPCYIRGNFDAKFQTLMNLLGTMSGYQRIECSNDTTHYRMGIPVIPQTPKVKRINEDGYFDLSFNCKPQRFLTSGETIINVSNGQTITNPTGFAAMPQLIFDYTGTYTFKFENGYTSSNPAYRKVDATATIDGIFISSLIIDSALMECYDMGDQISANQFVTFTPNVYPILYGADGQNTTKVTTNTGFRMRPNWWEL